MPLLDVKNLSTNFYLNDSVVRAVDDVSFSIKSGEVLGIVGESGSGKTVLSLSMMRLVPSPPGKIVSGSIMFSGKSIGGQNKDIITASSAEMRSIRGSGISMIFQEPMTALDPVYTIGNQIKEAITSHERLSKSEIDSRIMDVLKRVGMPDPYRRIKEYSHQLSGGMRQRAMIAIALACNPALLIADEPTTALDVTIQAQILNLMRQLKESMNMSMMLITHDLGVIAEMADRVAVMYAGRLMEIGTADEIFNHPMHPYTQGLINSIAALSTSEKKRLPTIRGNVPDLSNLPSGCAFANRCDKAKVECTRGTIPDDPCGVGRLVRCLFAR